jgi:MPBQ/MSBQ methyltransferase
MSSISDKVANKYDDTSQGLKNKFAAELYSSTDFLNWGYWREDTKDVGEACENLMGELLNFIPEKKGNILDVACGKGATTRYLLRYFKDEDVTGINISRNQLAICADKLPNCRFLLMDATKLEFDDESFQNIICVEAAHHFDTREIFLRQAHRILAKGGHLILSDIRTDRKNEHAPIANFTENLDEYRSVYKRAGFDHVEIRDVTEKVRGGLADHYMKFAKSKMQSNQMNPVQFARFVRIYRQFRPTFKTAQNYLLVKCVKL